MRASTLIVFVRPTRTFRRRKVKFGGSFFSSRLFSDTSHFGTLRIQYWARFIQIARLLLCRPSFAFVMSLNWQSYLMLMRCFYLYMYSLYLLPIFWMNQTHSYVFVDWFWKWKRKNLVIKYVGISTYSHWIFVVDNTSHYYPWMIQIAPNLVKYDLLTRSYIYSGHLQIT